ncbi:Aminotransferase-like isoform 2 [Theobroma cacao]|uniref:Aminotransferase-like isoform 2 n=1 Tax=Theobroma cacao TaxID=3641 RepID=A0A061EQ60_THECC|nr:Aminotransferase-like isoform 2 [Theobroma cacao]
MRRSTRKSSMGLGLGVEEPLNSNSIGSFRTRFSLSSFVKRVEKLTDDQRNAVKKVGFGNLLLIPNQMLSKNLLVELMERWHSEERGFMLLPGILKITLMDVALILGICVIGDPILLREDEAFSDLESDYGAALWKRKITVASLESRLDSLGEAVNEDFVRTFILFMFGTLLFPNANGKVDSRYLSFLKNLDDIGHFAWGAAVLEDIFMWLNKRKESNVQYVGGCLILLQVVGLQIESDVHHSTKVQVQQGKKVSLMKQSKLSRFFPELQTMGFPSKSCPLELHKEHVELSSQCQNSEKLTGGKVVGLHLESDVTNTSKLQVQKGQEVHLKQSTASQQKAEVQIEKMEFPSTSCASELHKEFIELSSQCQNSEKLTVSGNVVGLHLESDVTTTSNAQEQEGQEVHLKHSTASIPEVQTEVVAFPSPSCVSKLHKECGELPSQCQNSEKFMSGNEDELIKRNRVLEVQNMELRKEIEDLKVENRQLKMYFSSTNDLVTRLEGLVMDETYSS